MGLAAYALGVHTISDDLLFVVACSARLSMAFTMATVLVVRLAILVGSLCRLGHSRFCTLAEGLPMKTGLLWFDDDPRTGLEEKVRRAAKHFKRKYGFAADTCLVHRSVFTSRKEKRLSVGGITVRPHHPVLYHHLWLGCENRETRAVPR